MEFQHISSKFPKLPAEYHYYLFNNDKIWLFSRNYVAQPTYNWGHRVAFAGGYSSYFDTSNFEWDPKEKVDYKEQAKEENLEELLFTFKTEIFMLLYSHFGGIQFLSLLRFNENAREFERFASIESDQKSQRVSQSGHDSKHIAVLIDGDTSDGKYLVTYVDGIMQVHLLKISIEDQRSQMEYITEIPFDKINLPPMFQPVSGVVIDGNLYLLGAMPGCGLRWVPMKVVRVDLKSGEASLLEATGDHPSFAFMGSSHHAFNPRTKSWFHFTGHRQKGMSSTEFNGEIYSLHHLAEGKPKWVKEDLVVYDMETGDPMVVADTDAENLYIGSPKIGIDRTRLNPSDMVTCNKK